MKRDRTETPGLLRDATERLRTREAMVAVAALVVLLAGILASTKVSEPGGGRILTIVLSVVAAFLAGLVDYIILRPETVRALEQSVSAIDQAVGIDRSVREAGLIEVITEKGRGSAVVDEILRESPEVKIVLNHAASWVTTHRDALNARISTPTNITYIMIAKPGSHACRALASRESRTEDRIEGKIRESIEEISAIAQEHNNKNTWILGYEIPSPAAVVIGDTRLTLQPYYSAPKVNQARPAKLLFQRTAQLLPTDQYSVVSADVDALQNAASTEQLWPEHPGAAQPATELA